jgi:hypothetical protein
MKRRAPLSRFERILIRISIVQMVIAALGIFTGAVALYAALNEADAVRKQQQAIVWPDLLIGRRMVTNALDPSVDGAEFSFVALNSGIGPARVRAFRVSVDGTAQRTWGDVLIALLGDDAPRNVSVDLIGERTVLPGEPLAILIVPGLEPAQRLAGASQIGRITIEACYCSVFDECWTTKVLTPSEPVRACPDYGSEQFLE